MFFICGERGGEDKSKCYGERVEPGRLRSPLRADKWGQKRGEGDSSSKLILPTK